MAYGTLKVDNITYTSGGSDASTSVSGIVDVTLGNFNNITATGTISGLRVTGNTAGFSTVTGGTVTGTTANFVAGNFTTSITGVTVTGTTANFQSGVFTTQISGVTITGTTANFTSGNYTGTLSGATTNDSKGNVRAIPQNTQTGSYTLVTGDAGKHVFTTAGVTVPSGVFAVGDAISIYNNTTGNITITQGTGVTLRQAGASGTGNRTLAQRGLATVLCVSGAAGTEFVIGGAGIT